MTEHTKKQIKGFAAYATRDVSGRHSSAQRGERPPTGKVRPHVEELRRNGYVVLPGLFTREEMDALRQEVTPLLGHAGRNNFEGLETQRLYSVIGRTRICDPIVEHPMVLGILDQMLLPPYLLSQLQVINIRPGEAAQPLHSDDAWYRVKRPRPALGIATIFAVDDFTDDNGATVVIPKSHEWDDRLPTEEDVAKQVPVVMSSGSAVMFLGTLWHGGGANRSKGPRMAVTAQYCEPWCRPQENFSLSVRREVVSRCSPEMQSLLGYSIYGPFMGMVNGMHPRRLLDGPTD